MKVPTQIPVELNQLKLKFDYWRKTRTKRVLSDPLWQEAVELSRVHGLSLVSRILRLSYEELRTRATKKVKLDRGLKGTVPVAKPATRPQFVEVQRVPFIEGSRGKTARIRVQLGFGKNLEISLNSPDASDWENLFSGIARTPLHLPGMSEVQS